MAAGHGALDHEAVGAGGGVTGKVGSQHVGGDNGQELGPSQLLPGTQHRVGPHLHRDRSGAGTYDVDVDPAGPSGCQRVQEHRELGGDARPDQHVIDAGEHGAVTRGRRRHLELLHQVDPDKALVALFGQEDLDEIGGDHQVGAPLARVQRGAGHGAEGFLGTYAAVDEVALKDLLRHASPGEMG